MVRTEIRSKFGTSTTLGVFPAVFDASSAEKEESLYCHIDDLAGNPEVLLPGHAINVINGESHGGNKLAMQELMILPFDPSSFRKTICPGTKGYYNLNNIIKDKPGKNSTCVSDGDGFASSLELLFIFFLLLILCL